ncbi:hypothetical protein FIU85_13265 [Roseovarius sp. THAF8]|nr:hypothetical protein FIU85_13265 [Roseovarius sp. THAF8]
MNIVILLLAAVVIYSFISMGKRARRTRERKKDDKDED